MVLEIAHNKITKTQNCNNALITNENLFFVVMLGNVLLQFIKIASIS